MIGAEHREMRDLLRSRLQLVTRAVRCQHAVGSLLEKYNVSTPTELPELARLQAGLQGEQRALLRTHIKRVEATLKQRLLPTPDVQRLVWVLGVGKLGAYTLVLEIDDVGRFPIVRHFHSYCRLVPGADDSAGKTRHKRSRDGSRYRKLVFHTAVRAAQYHPEIRQEYRRLARRRGKIVARALIAKERASIVYWVLRKREAFNGKFRGHVLTPKPARWPRLASP
jgi:transposase